VIAPAPPEPDEDRGSFAKELGRGHAVVTNDTARGIINRPEQLSLKAGNDP
jgi:hypothetical protein